MDPHRFSGQLEAFRKSLRPHSFATSEVRFKKHSRGPTLPLGTGATNAEMCIAVAVTTKTLKPNTQQNKAKIESFEKNLSWWGR